MLPSPTLILSACRETINPILSFSQLFLNYSADRQGAAEIGERDKRIVAVRIF